MKIKFLLSSCVLVLFAILAGGSFDGDDITFFFWTIGGAIVLFVIAKVIESVVKSHNKSKRLEMIQKDEAENNDFDRSVSYGNDRCKFYFDASKRQLMIMRVTTEGINKQFVDDFEFCGKDLCRQSDPYACIYDSKNRKLLTCSYDGTDFIYNVKDVAAEDKNKDIVPNSTIAPRIVSNRITRSESSSKETAYALVEESQGLISIIRKGQVSSLFNYIDGECLSKKTGSTSHVNEREIGNYLFIMDDFFNVLVLVTPSSYEVINYSDIIEVSYEENGTQLFSKSSLRTVGGAVVGGALMGGAGAVVGGLSGSSKKDMEIRSMKIRILLRDTQNASCVLNFNDSKRALKTKESDDNTKYHKYRKNAYCAKDLLSVIIDKAKQETITTSRQEAQTPSSQLSVADELAKLAKLKADGILTDEEFNAQKAKLLNM